jgi:hypothetical protein
VGAHELVFVCDEMISSLRNTSCARDESALVLIVVSQFGLRAFEIGARVKIYIPKR